MAEAILKYDLNDPDDRQSHLRAIKSLDLCLLLWDIDQHLRGQIKYGELDDQTYKALEDTRTKLHQLMSEYNVSLDELMS